MNLIEAALRPGTLLLTPPDAGERASDVLCVFDADQDNPGAYFALVLNKPTDQPAQPLTFSLFDLGDDTIWWGGPTHQPFALVESHGAPDRTRPDGSLRPLLTDRVAVYFPGQDHAPSRPPKRVKMFQGSVWLSAHDIELFREEGILIPATADGLFDPEPETAANRLRARAGRIDKNRGVAGTAKSGARYTQMHGYYNALAVEKGLDEGEQTALAERQRRRPVLADPPVSSEHQGVQPSDRGTVLRIRSNGPGNTQDSGQRDQAHDPIRCPDMPWPPHHRRERRRAGLLLCQSGDLAASHEARGRRGSISSPIARSLTGQRARRLPILAELKIGGDRTPYFALVQLLALASDLLPRTQLNRLRDQYPERFLWSDDGPFADLYIIAFNPPKTGKYREPSFDATRQISEKLIKDRVVSSLVRRIAYVEATSRGEDLVFYKKFAFPEDA